MGIPSLAPDDCLKIAPSVKVRSVIWACMVHPGSTNSSRVVGSEGDALVKICQRDFTERAKAARDGTAAGNSEYIEPCRREIVAGGGSLAGIGLQMLREINREAALVAEPEMDNVVQRFNNETSIDLGAPAKLHVPLKNLFLPAQSGFLCPYAPHWLQYPCAFPARR